MTPAEEKMYQRLAKRHRLIRLHGAKAADMLAEEEALKAKREAWVVKHNLSCYECHTKFGEWVAGGRRKSGSLWVWCKRCAWDRARKEKEARQKPTT